MYSLWALHISTPQCILKTKHQSSENSSKVFVRLFVFGETGSVSSIWQCLYLRVVALVQMFILPSLDQLKTCCTQFPEKPQTDLVGTAHVYVHCLKYTLGSAYMQAISRLVLSTSPHSKTVGSKKKKKKR